MRRAQAVTTLPKHNTVITSRIRLNVKMLKPLSQLKAHLRDLPCLLPVYSGTIIRYAVLMPNDKEAAELEFGQDHINLVSFYDAPTIRSRNLELIVLICLLSYLKGFYSIELDELYPYLTEALKLSSFDRANEHQHGSNVEESISSLNKMNLSLSRSLLSLHTKNINLSNESKALKSTMAVAFNETRRYFGLDIAEKILSIFKEAGAPASV